MQGSASGSGVSNKAAWKNEGEKTIMQRRQVLLAACGALLARGATAATYPARPINLIVPYGPGGGVGINATSPDELRRAVNEAMDSGKPTLINAVIDPGAGSESGRIGNLNPQSALRKK